MVDYLNVQGDRFLIALLTNQLIESLIGQMIDHKSQRLLIHSISEQNTNQFWLDSSKKISISD